MQIAWSAETVADASASQQLEVNRFRIPACVSVELVFAADPGTFQVDFQVADTDSDSNYVSKTSLSTGLNASFVGRIELSSVVARFIRLLKVSTQNQVGMTARVTQF